MRTLLMNERWRHSSFLSANVNGRVCTVVEELLKFFYLKMEPSHLTKKEKYKRVSECDYFSIHSSSDIRTHGKALFTSILTLFRSLGKKFNKLVLIFIHSRFFFLAVSSSTVVVIIALGTSQTLTHTKKISVAQRSAVIIIISTSIQDHCYQPTRTGLFKAFYNSLFFLMI